MVNNYKTEQEEFWAGNFGDEYIARNQGSTLIASNIALFAKILTYARSVQSVIEFGANIGLNLQAINYLLPRAELSAIEINQTAVKALNESGSNVKIYHQSILDFIPDYQRNLVFCKGVLIHISPKRLPEVYELIYKTSNRYICIVEYYNPLPVEVDYRGHLSKLFKRDFAGEMLDKFQDLQLVNYGFIYHRDSHFPQDDTTWFLLEKTGST